MNSKIVEAQKLDGVLADWEVAPGRVPQFRAAVWARIEASRVGRTWFDHARAHVALTTGLAAVALVAGGWIGREKAQTRVAADRALLADNYVRSLDARTMRMP